MPSLIRPVAGDLTGTTRLVALLVRRDRIRLAVWVLGLSATVVASAASLLGLYSDQRAIESYGAIFADNPALVVFAGPGHGLDDPTIGAILVNETQLWCAVAVALMSSFLVVRHTRGDEDEGRADLVMSGAVGRLSPLAASVVVVTAAEALVAVLCTVGLVALGYPTVGVVALTVSWFVVGTVFVAVAALAAQFAGSARSALAVCIVVLAASFVLRAIGDIAANGVVWTSPIGWAQAVRPFAGERWWTLLLCATAAVAGATVSGALARRRDLGSGVLVGRPGRERAPGWAVTPLGFHWRRQRGPLAGWAVGLGAMGALYGTMVDDVDELLLDNPQVAEIFALLEGVDLTGAYLAATMSMVAIMATGFGVSTVLSSLRDEQQGRADLVLSLPVARSRWLRCPVLVAAVGSSVAVMCAGCGTGVVAMLVLDDHSLLVDCLAAAVSTLPAVLVVLGVAVVLVGAAPRWAAAAWGVIAFVAVVTFLGDVLDLPWAVRRLSPFAHVPRVPAEDPSLRSAAGLGALAVALVWVGLRAYERRDVYR